MACNLGLLFCYKLSSNKPAKRPEAAAGKQPGPKKDCRPNRVDVSRQPEVHEDELNELGKENGINSRITVLRIILMLALVS